MENNSKTLYIPLYGKALVDRKGIILSDPKAAAVWEKEQFALKGKAKSRWLAYYMAMRAAVMDEWCSEKLREHPDAVVLHLGCGLDARCERVQADCAGWYDLDLPQVISLRRQYFTENGQYHMQAADLTDPALAQQLPAAKRAVVVMEGVSMYLPLSALQNLFGALQQRYEETELLVDVYTRFGVQSSARANPINTVGAQACTGVDVPEELVFSEKVRPHPPLTMTPQVYIDQLSGFERFVFRRLFAGRFADRIYKLFAYTIR